MKKNNNKSDHDLEPTEKPRRRAGLRPDELEPGQSDPEVPAGERHAAGTAGGGEAFGGLGGTNEGVGTPDALDSDEDNDDDELFFNETEVKQKF